MNDEPELVGGALVDAFFRPWEKDVADFDSVNHSITNLFQRLVREEGRLFAWRGVVNASWPLHSSLYRRILFFACHAGKGTPVPLLVLSLSMRSRTTASRPKQLLRQPAGFEGLEAGG